MTGKSLTAEDSIDSPSYCVKIVTASTVATPPNAPQCLRCSPVDRRVHQPDMKLLRERRQLCTEVGLHDDCDPRAFCSHAARYLRRLFVADDKALGPVVLGNGVSV